MAFRVAVYRLQLFKPSETFIASQVKALPSVDSLLVGRLLFGSPDASIKYWTPQTLRGRELLRFVLAGSPRAFLGGLSLFRPTIIHAHFSIDGLYALKLARKLDAPLITTLHGFDVTTSNGAFAKSGRPALMRYALLKGNLQREGAHFICVSNFILDAALRAGYPESRLSLHYIGVDLDKCSLKPAERSPRLIHVARLVEKKGTRYLLDAMAIVSRRVVDVRLDIVGDGPLRHDLEAQAAALGLGASIRFFGTRSHEDVIRLIAGATALVLPSVKASNGDSEGLGQVLLEAAASGVPVVGTRHGGIPEAVKDGETGYLVPERDPNELAEAILNLVQSAAARERMGAAALKFARDRFDINKQSASLENLYRRTC